MDRFDCKCRHDWEITFEETDIPLHKQRRWSRENRSFNRTSACRLNFCGCGNIKHFLWSKVHEERINKNIHLLENMSGSKQTSFYWPVMSLFICTCADKKNLCLKIKECIHSKKVLWQLSIMQHLPTTFLVYYELDTIFVSCFLSSKICLERLTHLPFPDFFLSWCNSPHWARASSFTRFLDHTQRRTTVGRTPLGEWSTRHRYLCLTTHNTHNKHPCAQVGFKPTISAGQGPQTYALGRAVTGTGHDAGKHYKLIITKCINLFKTYAKTYIHLFSVFGGLFNSDAISSHCINRISISM
jgi:hypothetical protein